MSLRKPSKVSPTTGSDHASSSADAAAIASRTTPTLNGVGDPDRRRQEPDSRTHSSPVSSPFAVQAVAAGEERRLGRDDHRHAGAHRVAFDQRRVADAHAGDVGDARSS